MHRTTVVHVCPSAPPRISGSTRYAIELSKSLRSHGVTSILVALSDSDSVETYEGLTIVELAVPWISRLDLPLPTLRYSRILRKTVRDSRADFLVTHTRFYPSSLLASIEGALTPGMKLIHVEHGACHLIHDNPLVAGIAAAYDHTLAAVGLALVDACVAVGPSSRRFLRHIGYRGPITLVPNATSLISPATSTSDPPNPRSSPVLLYAGRISRSKGLLTLIDSCALLSDRDFKLVVAGDGPDLIEIETYAKSKCHGKIEFLGRREDVGALIENADLVVVPSIYDSMPSIVLEAAAAGRRVIASNVGDIPYILGDDYKYLFCAGKPVELAERIRLAMDGEDFRDSILRSRIEHHFSWESSSKEFIGLLGTLGARMDD